MKNEIENRIQENILKGLKSGDSQKVIETIGELRESGNVAYIPLLLNLLNSSLNPEIRKNRLINKFLVFIVFMYFSKLKIGKYNWNDTYYRRYCSKGNGK